MNATIIVAGLLYALVAYILWQPAHCLRRQPAATNDGHYWPDLGPLDWSKLSHCVKRTDAEKQRLGKLCNPYSRGDGARVHQLHNESRSTAQHDYSRHRGTIASEHAVNSAGLGEHMRVDLGKKPGSVTSLPSSESHSLSSRGLQTVMVEEVPCATHGCCAATLSIRPESPDFQTLQSTFVWSRLKFLLDLPFEPKTILDVGGPGLSAVWLSLLYPAATIYRLEPNPSTFDIGVVNALDFPNIKHFNLGIWSKNTVLQLCTSGVDDWGDWPFLDQTRPSSPNQEGVLKDKATSDCSSKAEDDIRVARLSDFMRLLSIERFDLIKMDFASAEEKVFSGDPGIHEIASGTEVFISEMHERFTPGSGEPMRELFRGLGYAHILEENEIFVKPSLLQSGCDPMHVSKSQPVATPAPVQVAPSKPTKALPDELWAGL